MTYVLICRGWSGQDSSPGEQYNSHFSPPHQSPRQHHYRQQHYQLATERKSHQGSSQSTHKQPAASEVSQSEKTIEAITAAVPAITDQRQREIWHQQQQANAKSPFAPASAPGGGDVSDSLKHGPGDILQQVGRWGGGEIKLDFWRKSR